MIFSLKHNTLLRYILIICWLLTAVIGYDAFFKNHELLTVPIFNLAMPASIVFLSAIGMFTTAVFALILKPVAGKYLFALSVILYVIICIADAHRITPYMIMFLSLFSFFTFFREDNRLLYTALIFLCSGIYIFSGLHKFNINFATNIGPIFYFHSLPFPYNLQIGYAMAGTEVLLGILLLFRPTRKVASRLLIVMHLLIIWKLSPWKYGWNYIVMPWNMIMIFINVYVLRQFSLLRFKISSGRLVFIGLALFFWIIPGLSFLIYIPENISQKLYSGTTTSGYISFTKKEKNFKSLDLIKDKEEMLISLKRLSMKERGIAFNTETYIYEAVYAQFCQNYQSADQLHLGSFKEIKKNLP